MIEAVDFSPRLVRWRRSWPVPVAHSDVRPGQGERIKTLDPDFS